MFVPGYSGGPVPDLHRVPIFSPSAPAETGHLKHWVVITTC